MAIYTAVQIYNVADETALAAKFAAHVASRLNVSPLPPGPVLAPPQVTAYINQNRWLFDCIRCGAGVGCDPTWTSTNCFGGCRTRYTDIVFPNSTDRAAIESALLARPDLKNRNWLPGETAADLLAENAANGL